MTNWLDDFLVPPMSEGRKVRSIRDLQRQLGSLKSRVQSSHDSASSDQSDLRLELEVLDFNFSRTILLLQALVQALLRKNLISREELQSVIDEFDLLDGKADNQLDPSAVPGMKPRPVVPESTAKQLRDFAQSLGTDPLPSTREFLRQLESEADAD